MFGKTRLKHNNSGLFRVLETISFWLKMFSNLKRNVEMVFGLKHNNDIISHTIKVLHKIYPNVKAIEDKID